jgi:hypothetical protein
MQQKVTLSFCIIMDLIGCASYLLPFLGEWFDLAWAPISAAVFYFKFGGKSAFFGSILNFVEELLPYTDIIPTFTLTYVWEKRRRKKIE